MLKGKPNLYMLGKGGISVLQTAIFTLELVTNDFISINYLLKTSLYEVAVAKFPPF